MIIEEKDLFSFFQQCVDGNVGSYSEVVVPVDNQKGSDLTHFGSFSSDKTCVLDGYRTVDPLKVLYYMPRETVLPVDEKRPMRIVAGAKACDIKAMQVLDAGLSGEEFQDPTYKIWREQTLVISSDCTETAATCHCTLLGGKPYVETGSDVNLSRVQNNFLLTAGSEKGELFLKELKKVVQLQNASEADQKFVAENRKAMTQKVEAQNKDLTRGETYHKLREDQDKDWPIVSETCVGCGACTNICPTCYCLILNDESKTKQFVKVRSYDSCQWHGYARVAGGDSPRPKMFQRFRNRYLCKYLFMKSDFNLLGCTGCGRCTDACAGNIDFRKVVKRITDGIEMAVLEEKEV